MNVKNRACIRRLSLKTLKASRKRNIIAVIAIILTSVLFTSLFTIAFSINSSYQTYTFRQIGGYCHGTFKNVTAEQAQRIARHPRVKSTGQRMVIGSSSDGVFAKEPAEVSYMDENCTRWSYAEPTTGHMPQTDREIAMDTKALDLLGVEPQLGACVSLTYMVGDKEQSSSVRTDTFILAGYWEYDDLCPVHYLNISREYAEAIEQEAIASGFHDFRTDLNVMMVSSLNIRKQMEQTEKDLGYTWENPNDENYVRIGVNWGYSTAQLDEQMDLLTFLALLAFLILVTFTGYLIIYNIFRISVTGDIRFYGLLKTIGVTPGQLRRLIRLQALYLCLVGIPAGLLLGYCVGAVLTPVVMANSSFGASVSTLSTSPLIFVGSSLFSAVTVLLSCARPGRIAAKVSPVEAAKYTEYRHPKKKRRRTRGAGICQMALASLGRNRMKTLLVILSLSLSVVLLNILITFVQGFDTEKYLDQKTCADFIVSSPEYFRYIGQEEPYITQEAIDTIQAGTVSHLSGCGYTISGPAAQIWMEEETWIKAASAHIGTDQARQALSIKSHNGDRICQDTLIEGLDPSLFDKLTVIDGDMAPLFQEDSRAIALAVDTDDYGNVIHSDLYPALGETISVSYPEDAFYIDSRTGEKCNENTPEEFLQYHTEGSQDVEYTVCAYVSVPYPMSYRYSILGGSLVLPVDSLRKDSQQTVIPLFYLFDTPDRDSEEAAEQFLADMTSDSLSDLMYESKSSVRKEFESFRQMFLLLGSILCSIIELVGILNFFNAVMTGIFSRKKEFAVLQAVGMTGYQLKEMLIWEGLFYAFSAAALALLLSATLNPLMGVLLEKLFWFFTPSATLVPVLITIPVFALLGWMIPSVMYQSLRKHSIVDRLREGE